MKQEAMEAVRHIHAQDAAWFFLFVVALIAVVLWFDIRKDKKGRK